MKHTPTPNYEYVPKDSLVSQEVFHVGNPELTRDIVMDDKRFFYWTTSDYDDGNMKRIAGWGRFHTGDEGTRGYVGCLEIPLDTISAKSALAGTEAWNGEKKEIIDAISNYVRGVYHYSKRYDSNLSLETVAVPRGNRGIFILPPHQLEDLGDGDAKSWLDHLYADLDRVLSNEPRKDELIRQLHRKIGFLEVS